MTFGQFKASVAGYMNREVSVFVSNGVDLLSNAVNQAKRWAERQHNFELSRVSAQIPNFTLAEGGSFDNIQDLAGNPLEVKCIERAFISHANDQYPVEVISRAVHQNRIRRKFEETLGETESYHKMQLVQHGSLVYLAPGYGLNEGDPFTLKLDVIKWLPRYFNDPDTDFLLEYCEDFMMFRTVFQLNFLIKEDDRVGVSAKALADSWESVLRWDNNIVIGSNDDVSLD